MNKNLIRALLVTGIAALPASSLASDLNYNYFGLSYLSIDDFVDFDGVGVNGSIQINYALFLRGAYSRLQSDGRWFPEGPRSEIDAYEVGVGYRYELVRNTDLNLVASLLRSEHSLRSGWSGSAVDNGYGVSAAVRHMFSYQFEMDGGLKYVDIGNSSETSVGVGAMFHLTDFFSLRATYSRGDHANSWSAGVRLNY